MERLPEPELMEGQPQADAYAEADFAASDGAFVELIRSEVACRPVRPRRAIDLGCGPGNISFPLAAALGGTPVLGLDGAAAMLAHAAWRLASAPGGWPQLRFTQAVLPLPEGALDGVPEAWRPPFDLLVSNSLLHHLHDPQVLLNSLRRLASPGALVVVRDLRRPDSPAAVESLVERHASDCPAVLRHDYRASLRAAFRPEEVEAQLAQAGLHGWQVRQVEDRYLDVIGRIG